MRSDGELLSAWRDGDKAAGQELYGRYFPIVYRFFSNKVREDVADLVQRTFLACTGHRERLRDDSSFRSFVLVVARNELSSHLRKRYKDGDALDISVVSLADLGVSPSQLIGRRDEHRLLLLALRRIPIELQQLVELYYFEKLPGHELAEALEIPEGTVRSRLRRALAMLRTEIERLAESPELAASTLGSIDGWAAEIRQLSDLALADHAQRVE